MPVVMLIGNQNEMNKLAEKIQLQGDLTYQVVVCDSFEAAEAFLERHSIDGVMAQNTLHTDYLALLVKDWNGNAEEVQIEDEVIQQIFLFIREHLLEEVTREQIATHVHFHPVYLSRFFKKKTGKSLSDYIHERRIEKAKSLLCQSDLKVQQIVQILGCYHPSHFTRLFKKTTGLTPLQYRRQALMRGHAVIHDKVPN